MRVRVRSIAIGFSAGALLLGCAADSQEATGDYQITSRNLSKPLDGAVASTSLPPASPRESRQHEVDDYNRLRSESWSIVDTRVSSSGQIIDYVAAETLIPGAPKAPFAGPTSPPDHDAKSVDIVDANGPFPAKTEMQADASLEPPPGTVPVLREQFATYIDEGDGYRDLDDFIAKLPRPSINANGGHLYGKQFSRDANLGAIGTINLWRYSEVEFSSMSLMQGGIGCPAIPGTRTQESVEVGFQRSRFIYGDDNLHLFTYFTTTSYATEGNYVGGYNRQYLGFVPAVGATALPGQTVSSSTLSIPNGAQYECTIMFDLGADGNWYVWACGVKMGYYPTQRSTTVPSAQRVRYNLLNNLGCGSAWYGEVVQGTLPGFPPFSYTAVDMGSGRFPTAGWGLAAYIRNPGIWPNSPTATSFVDIPNRPDRSTAIFSGYDARCYGVSDITTISGLGRAFFVGGPGYNPPTGCM